MNRSIKDILQRQNQNVHKNDFGHVLVIAGSPRMLGASALCSLAAMRAGAGLVTAAVPKSLNKVLQAKISSVVMTWPLPETLKQTFSLSAFKNIFSVWDRYQAVVIGPGISRNLQTEKLILKIIEQCPLPIVIDADALHALSGHLDILHKRKAATVLTPHVGEMAVLTGLTKAKIQKSRESVCADFVRKYPCVLVLKGHETIVARDEQTVFDNSSGNPGMATAGSGDVLAGMIGAFLAQGAEGFLSAKYGVYLHGCAGDLAAKDKSRIAMIATDIIEKIPEAILSLRALAKQSLK